ncbi:NAD(+)/NADH kinase [Candidatus Micrarchaeota archaeon]|nr:NAD(+)/NADH kinase [Candidatus Micrarchaeota archaeon]
MGLSAYVVANPKKPAAAKVKGEVEGFLRENGVEVSESGRLLVTIGGDGTILHNNRHFDKDIFAIGSQSSFLCQARLDNWRGMLGKILKGYKVQQRLMLASELDGKRLPDALNEVCVRNKEHRILVLGLEIGQRHYGFRADGVLFATPTGSPAYCYSCGGEELPAGSNAYEAVAIAPFRREFAPTVVPASVHCSLVVESECDADVVIDGQEVFPLEQKSTVKIWVSDKKAKFVIV